MYPSPIDCQCIMTTHPDSKLHASVQALSLLKRDECHDWLILASMGTKEKHLQIKCGNLDTEEIFETKTNELMIHFHSQEKTNTLKSTTNTDNGFQLNVRGTHTFIHKMDFLMTLI